MSLGAAVLAGILSSEIDASTVVITDVSPFNLGVAVVREIDDQRVSGFFDALIEKQSTIPRTARKTYSTSADWQDAVHVEVYQGDAAMCSDNEPIDDFLHPMKPAPAGATLEIEFSYNLNGVVEIVVRDCQTGLETKRAVRPAKLRMSASEKDTAKRRLDNRWKNTSAAAAAPPPPAQRSSATPVGPSAAPKTGGTEDNGEWRSSPLYPRVQALMAFAEKQMTSLSGQQRAQVDELVRKMRAALAANNAAALDAHEQKLTDLLFELG